MSDAKEMKTIEIGPYKVGQDEPLLIIGGPCALESDEVCLEIGEAMKARCEELGFNYVFKASFDKANRSSIHSNRGPGLEEGLKRIAALRDQLGVPVTTDFHESYQAEPVGEVVDVLQVPAFLCRQTDLLVAAAKTGKAVNVKKGQFMSPAEMGNVIRKLEESGCPNIMLTERGTTFGYNRLITDFIGLGDMMEMGYPTCFDVTHSTQQPGGEGTRSGGRSDRAPLLARAATVAGVNALFLETHPCPAEATSDKATMMVLEDCVELLGVIKKLRDVI